MVVYSPPGTASPSTEGGQLARFARQVRHWSLRVTLFCRQDCESRWRHTSIYSYIRISRTRACTRTVYTSGEQGRELQFAASMHPCIHPSILSTVHVTAIRAHACGTCPIAAIWLPRATNFSFVFSLVSPAGFVGSEQD